MYLKNIHIKNFKGLPEVEVKDLKTINIFTGENHTGKTSILESIILLVGASNPTSYAFINEFRGIVTNKKEDLLFNFSNQDHTIPIEIEGEFKKKITRKLNIKANYNSSQNANNANQERVTNIINTGSTLGIEKTPNEIIFNFTDKEKGGQEKGYQSSLGIDSNGKLLTKTPSNYKGWVFAIFISSQNFHSNEALEALDDLLINKAEKRLIGILQEVIPDIQGLSFNNASLIFANMKNMDKLIPFYLLGEGIKRILYIVLSVYSVGMHLANEYQNRVLLIDEVENGLHFSSFPSLWRAIISLAKELNIQILVTTHSNDALKSIREVINKEFKDMRDELGVYSVVKGDISKKVTVFDGDIETLDFAFEKDIEIR